MGKATTERGRDSGANSARSELTHIQRKPRPKLFDAKHSRCCGSKRKLYPMSCKQFLMSSRTPSFGFLVLPIKRDAFEKPCTVEITEVSVCNFLAFNILQQCKVYKSTLAHSLFHSLWRAERLRRRTVSMF